MPEERARKEKVCQEEDCRSQWRANGMDDQSQCLNFIYCPFCANELTTRCSQCGEEIHDTSFGYCPWCGTKFQAEEN